MTVVNLTFACVFLCAATSLSGRATAADLSATLTVDRVTVYPQGAIVTRAGSVQIPAGSHRLQIGGLPAGIDVKSLHVAIESAAVRLGGIEAERINEGQFVSDAERSLRRKLEQTTDRRAAVEDEVATAQLQLKLLDTVASGSAGGVGKETVDGPNLRSVLGTLATNSATARARVREANAQSRELDRQIEVLKADLAKVATQSKQSTRVQASLDAAAPVTAIVTVSYRVTTANWHWIYEARLDTLKKRLTLERQGQVQQGSGEDWRDIELTLTTAPPTDDAATPVLAPVFVDLQVPLPRLAELKRTDAMVAAPAPMAAILSGNRDLARLESTDYLADYTVPGRVTVLADREPRLYPIAGDAFDVSLIARVVPNAGRVAHLEATFKYDRDVPLDSGELQLYRDGAYVGKAATKALLPGASVRMPFGVDERIRVAVQEEGGKSADRGILSTQTTRETRRRFEITSYHPAPIAVEVIDRVPVSKHADVHIDILKGATDPTDKDFEGNPGVYMWHLAAAPQKTISIHQYYSVKYPSDRQISETAGIASE